MNPPVGQMVWWRFKSDSPGPWRFGYVSYPGTAGLVRYGVYNGDISGGYVVSVSETEWKKH